MKKNLLATTAMAIAIVGTAAVAQEGSQGSGGGMSHSQGGAQHQLSPGGTSGSGHDQATPGGDAARNRSIPEKQGMGPPKGTSQNEEGSRSTRQRGAEENGKTMRRGAEENDRSNMRRGAEGNNRTNMQRGTEENNRTNTQRGAEENDRSNMRRGAEGDNRTNMQRGTEENNRTNMQRGAQENERGGAIRENRENNARIQERGGRTRSPAGRSVQLSESQRAQIKTLIVKDRNVPRVNSSSFSVAVGAAVPHDVRVAPLPHNVIRVVPEYRGFDYVVVRDRLLIIEPDTMKIIAILPA